MALNIPKLQIRRSRCVWRHRAVGDPNVQKFVWIRKGHILEKDGIQGVNTPALTPNPEGKVKAATHVNQDSCEASAD
jgi:hypothetical protein